MAAVAGKIQVVHGTQIGDARLPRRAQPLIGAIHVAEMRLAAAFGHYLAVNDRRLTGHALPGAVGVPGERPLVGMAPARLAVLIEVRQAVEFRMAVGVILVHHVDLQFAESPAKRHLAAGGKVLRREEQYLVAQKRAVQGAKNLVLQLVRQIDAGDLGAQVRRQPSHRKRPGLGGPHAAYHRA